VCPSKRAKVSEGRRTSRSKNGEPFTPPSLTLNQEMQQDRHIWRQAWRCRDPRFDGRFYVAVITTGVYCRPVCPARPPKERNVRYFLSAAAAAEAGFRPCLRCRPETSPGTPAWLGTSATVSRGLRIISENVTGGHGMESLAERLGVGSRHLSRLFVKHLGATPVAIWQTRRLQFAKTLIDETALPFTEIALAAGFGSIRRFNAAFRDCYGHTPTELRALARRKGHSTPGEYLFRLRYRPPFDWLGLLRFLRPRATPGVEAVGADSYRRTIALGSEQGWLEARAGSEALELRVRFPDPTALYRIVERGRRMFDLTADPREIRSHLMADPLLAPLVRARPGLRIPGAWDAFELAVRAILGQQVTVKGATTLAGRLVREFGAPIAPEGGLTHLFPTPERLAQVDLVQIGLPAARAACIRELARRVACGELALTGVAADVGLFVGELCTVPGIGPWTAEYVALRALGEPDAFPAGDLGLLRASGQRTPRELARRAERWRPWRAYAAMHLWNSVVPPRKRT
jgi:AraC family transcriptional regulator of adaptative response / DNA-3-methyladenine glycosylase II